MALYRDPYTRLRELAGGTPYDAPDDVPVASRDDLARESRRQIARGRSNLTNSVAAGVEDIKASGYAARGLLRIGIGDETGGIEDVQRSQEISQQAGEFLEGPQRLEDVDSFSSAAQYAGNSLARLAPQIGLGLATGGTGGLVAGGAAAAARTGLTRAVVSNVAGGVAQRAATRAGVTGVVRAEASKALQDRAARRVAARLGDDFVTRAVNKGAKTGVLGSSIVQQSSLAQDTVLDPNSTDSIGQRALKSAIGATVTGALDALPIVHLLGRYGVGDVAKKAVTGTLAQRVAKHAVAQGVEEGSMELAQSVGERLTHKWVNDNVELLSPDALSDYMNSAAMGFIGGGAFGAPAGIRGIKLESETGKQWANSFRDYLGKLRTPIKPITPDPAAAQDVADTGIDLGEIAANLKAAAPAAKDFTSKIDESVSEVANDVERAFSTFMDDDFRENSISEILEATPFEYNETSYGTALFNQGGGIDVAKSLIPQGRLLEVRQQFPDMHPYRATALAMVPDRLKAAELNDNGTLEEVEKLLRGEDPTGVDNDKISAFQEALPQENRGAFARVAHTMWQAANDKDFVPDVAAEGSGEVDPELAQRQGMEEQAPLRDTKAVVANWRKQEGKHLPRGTPQNTLILTKPGAKGVVARRPLSGATLGRLVIEARRADPQFAQLPQAQQVNQVIADFVGEGYSVEPDSIKPLTLGKGWMLTQQQATQLRNGLAPTPAAKATAATQGAPSERTKTAEEERALNAEFGRGERVDEARDEQVQMVEDATRPGPLKGGSPRTAPDVTAEGRLREGQTIDAGEIDTEAARAEREPDDFNALDALLERHTGEKVSGDFDKRRALYARVLKEGRRDFTDVKATLDDKTGTVSRRGKPRTVALSKSERAELVDAAERFAEAQREAAQKRVRSATNKVEATKRRWQKHKTPATFAEYKAAQKKLAKAESAYRESTEKLEAKGTPNLNARRVVEESAREESPLFDAASLAAQIEVAGSTRSRRALYDLTNRIEASALSEANKVKLLERVQERLRALQQTISTAGRKELATNNRRTMPPERFNKARDALKGAANVQDAIARLRDGMSVQQRVLADALTALGSLKSVPFKLELSGSLAKGSGNGAHQSGVETGKTLNSDVTLTLSSAESEVESIDVAALLLHEAMHAATAHAEQTNASARKELIKLLDHVRSEGKRLGIDIDSFYGLSETQEFIAEAFSNPELQSLLQNIKMPGEGAAAPTVWEAFKRWVAGLLGLDVTVKAQRDALDAVFEQGLALAKEVGDARNAAYAEVFGHGDTVSEHSIDAIESTPASGSQPSDYMSLLTPANRAYLEATLRRGDVYRQVRETLPPEQRRALDSVDEGPTLLVNTGLALALQGRLNLNADTKGFKAAVQALWDTMSQVLQVPSKNAYGRELIRQLQSGTPATQVDAEAKLLAPAAQRVHAFVRQRVKPGAQALFVDMDRRMRGTGVPALTQLATLLSQRTGEFRADAGTSLAAAMLSARNTHLNKAFEAIGKWDNATKTRVLAELQQNKAEVSKEAATLRAFFKNMHSYLTAAGVKMGTTEDYFPVSISPETVAARKDEFLALMSAPNFAATLKERGTSPDELFNASQSWNVQTQVGPTTFADGDHDPTFRPENKRLMDFIYKEGTPEQIEQFAAFQDQNLDRVVVQYVNRATRRAEWSRMGLDKRVPELLAKAKTQGATDKQLQLARDHVDMAMGVYGSDWNPVIKKTADSLGVNLPAFDKFEKLQSALVTYQNLRLLPLAAMSSLIDPLGVAVRTGSLRGVFDAYKSAWRAVRDQGGGDSLRALAQSMGIVERHAVSEALTHMYGSTSSTDPSSRTARLNSMLFKVNGLEYITKFSRLAALAAGNNFLTYHAAQDTPESTRYLSELGLTREDIKAGADGYVLRSEKIDAALNRFVNEAVVRPTPGQRPAWHNDPNFRLAAQYKGYLYSFFNTITRRALHELDKGNIAVLSPLLLYLPVTAMGEMMRDVFQGDDDDRDAMDYAKLAVVRSGLLGPHVGTFSDVRGDLNYGHLALSTVAGPTGQQLGKAYDAAIGERRAGTVAEEALPGSALYKDWD